MESMPFYNVPFNARQRSLSFHLHFKDLFSEKNVWGWLQIREDTDVFLLYQNLWSL